MPEVTQEFVGRHLDQWIAQYFYCREYRQKYTLGEFLAEYLPQLGNTYALQWIANVGKNQHAQGGANHTNTTNDSPVSSTPDAPAG